jgi:hypothetical protein
VYQQIIIDKPHVRVFNVPTLNQEATMTVDEQLRLIEAVQMDRPGYEVRIVSKNHFTEGEVQVRPIRARKAGRLIINPDWTSAGWCDDLLYRHGIRTYPPARSEAEPHT